jgi:hypothetical protein
MRCHDGERVGAGSRAGEAPATGYSAPIHHRAEAVTATVARQQDGKPGGPVAVNVKSAGAPRLLLAVCVTHQGSRIRAERRVAHAVS